MHILMPNRYIQICANLEHVNKIIQHYRSRYLRNQKLNARSSNIDRARLPTSNEISKPLENLQMYNS